MSQNIHYLFVYNTQYRTWNAYWNDTTDGYVATCMEMQNNAEIIDYVTNWWVGDFRPASSAVPGPWGHLWLEGDSGNHISDYWVRYCATEGGTVDSKQKFNFIWTCAN